MVRRLNDLDLFANPLILAVVGVLDLVLLFAPIRAQVYNTPEIIISSGVSEDFTDTDIIKEIVWPEGTVMVGTLARGRYLVPLDSTVKPLCVKYIRFGKIKFGVVELDTVVYHLRDRDGLYEERINGRLTGRSVPDPFEAGKKSVKKANSRFRPPEKTEFREERRKHKERQKGKKAK